MFLFLQLWGFSEFPQGLWVEGEGEEIGPQFPTPPSNKQLCLYFLHIGFPLKLLLWWDWGSHENSVWVGGPSRLQKAFPITSPTSQKVHFTALLLLLLESHALIILPHDLAFPPSCVNHHWDHSSCSPNSFYMAGSQLDVFTSTPSLTVLNACVTQILLWPYCEEPTVQCHRVMEAGRKTRWHTSRAPQLLTSVPAGLSVHVNSCSNLPWDTVPDATSPKQNRTQSPLQSSTMLGMDTCRAQLSVPCHPPILGSLVRRVRLWKVQGRWSLLQTHAYLALLKKRNYLPCTFHSLTLLTRLPTMGVGTV